MTDAASQSVFGGLSPHEPDGLLALIGACRADARPHKLDLGVGVYRDQHGRTPVFGAVKAAERHLLEMQDTKSYLGPQGDVGFLYALKPIIFGSLRTEGVFGAQTPGGTGALRLAADLLASGRPGARMFIGDPTWPNHPQIFQAAGLHLERYGCFDATTQTADFDATMAALETARPGDAVLLQACCHNPTGADPSLDQWATLARLIERRGLIPLIDLAYQGLGRGLEPDTAGMRRVLEAAPEALVAYSCDKNFGLYRERTGALFVLARDPLHLANAASNILALAGASWAMPPDHGAAVVRVILQDAAMSAQWEAELETMRQRLAGMRKALASQATNLAALDGHHGMFVSLPLTPGQVARLRETHAIYCAPSGRINLAGLTPETLSNFTHAYEAVRQASSVGTNVHDR